MMEIILYDCTRLLSRHSATTPTGIDRVDVWYLKHFLSKNKNRKTIGVYQSGETLLALDGSDLRALSKKLFDTWINGGSTSNNGMLSKLYSKTLGSKTKVVALDGSERIFRIDPELIKERRKYNESEFFYVNVSHHGISNEACYFDLLSVLKVRFVFFIHDIIPCDFPEYVRAGDDDLHSKRLLVVSKYADLILVNSKYTRDRLKYFYQVNSLRCPNIVELTIGVEDSFLDSLESCNKTSAPINGPYFVVIGTIEPRKNHMLLLNVWRDLVAKTDSPPQLVIIGKRGWSNQNILDMLDRCEGIQPYVREYTDISDAQMLGFLRGARALLFPSFVEGWGMPLAEALTAGVPCIVSDISVFHECSQEHALFINPLDGLGWLSAISEFSKSDSTEQAKYSEIVKNYVAPRWYDHFKSLDECLGTLPKKSISHSPLSFDELKSRWEQYKNMKKVIVRTKQGENIVDTLMLKVLTGRSLKRYQKFKRNPILFLKDSRFYLFRRCGQFLEKSR